MATTDRSPPESELDFERIREENTRRRAATPGSPAGLGESDRGVLGDGDRRDGDAPGEDDASRKAGGG